MHRENIFKNGVVLILLGLCAPLVFHELTPIGRDPALAGNMLFVISIVAVTACFGNFAFTYERVDSSRRGSRWLAHVTTGLLMFAIGMSLLMAFVVCREMFGGLWAVDVTWGVLYVASVLYDFWDLDRAHHE